MGDIRLLPNFYNIYKQSNLKYLFDLGKFRTKNETKVSDKDHDL